MPAEKKHIGVCAVPGSASAQSLESSASAPVPTGDIVTVPQPPLAKKSDSISASSPASRFAGLSTPARSRSHAANPR